MPTARRGSEERLPAAVIHFLVHGQLPPIGSPERDGIVQAFELRYPSHERTAYLAELRDLWLRHQTEIAEAAAGAEPWVVRVIANPSVLDEHEDDQGE